MPAEYRPPSPGPNLQSEKDRSFYLEAARFPDEKFSGVVYFAIQDILLNATHEDLSSYRIQLHQLWHVAVLGAMPTVEIREQLHQELAKGEITELPKQVIEALVKLRVERTKYGSWVEGHHRPGIVINNPADPPASPPHKRKPKKR